MVGFAVEKGSLQKEFPHSLSFFLTRQGAFLSFGQGSSGKIAGTSVDPS